MAYLRVDEQATYVDVYMDGAVFRVDNVSRTNGTWAFIYDPDSVGSSEWLQIKNAVVVGWEFPFSRTNARARLIKVVENTGSRVVLWVNGNYQDNSSQLANSDDVTIWITITPTKIVFHLVWITSGSSISLSSDDVNSQFSIDEQNCTSESNFYGTASETTGAEWVTVTNENYQGYTSTELNIVINDIYKTDSGLYRKYIAAAGTHYIGWNNGSIPVGVHEQVIIYIIDSADREAGSKQWDNSTDRIVLGYQYKDTTIADPSKGSWATDLVLPDNIGEDGFAEDGAWHVDLDGSDEAQIDWDRTRIGPSTVIHDWPFHTGTLESPTDHLIEHLKMDDNAASSTIVATVGNNANWETLENVNRNTQEDYVTESVKRGGGLDTKDTYMVDHVVTVYDNAYFKQGSRIITFFPQFVYNDAADQTIWSLYVDVGDYIQITYDAGNDRYELRVSWGGTLTTIAGSAFTENYSLQRLTTILASWDSEQDLLSLAINGSMVATGLNTGTPSTGNAAYVFTGADCESDADGTGQLPADILLDENKAVDGTVVPYGAWFTGNGGLDADTIHAAITYYWNCSGVTSSDYYRAQGSGAPSLNGGASYDTGVYGNGVKCDASGEYANLGQMIPAATGKFDIGFWYKETGAVAGYGSFFSNGPASSNNFGFGRNNSDTVWFLIWDDGADTIAVTTNVFNGNWHYIRLIVDTSLSVGRIKVFIDGKMEFDANIDCVGQNETITPTVNMYLGNQPDDTSDHIGGIIDEFTVICGKTYVPQIWTAFGKPLHIPLVNVQ